MTILVSIRMKSIKEDGCTNILLKFYNQTVIIYNSLEKSHLRFHDEELCNLNLFHYILSQLRHPGILSGYKVEDTLFIFKRYKREKSNFLPQICIILII